MRGDDQQQDGMFSYISPNKRVPQEHPLRRIRSIVDRVLDQLSPRFNKLYARAGRPSIAPEKLLRALLLQLLYSVRSERLLMEQLDYNLLFRWFKETSPKRSFRGFWEKHGPGSCSVTNTSRWMEHCWKLGRRTKASGQSILWARITTRSRNHRRHGGTRITPRSTIAERNALIRHTVPPPIRKPCWPARDQERKRN